MKKASPFFAPSSAGYFRTHTPKAAYSIRCLITAPLSADSARRE